MLKRVMLWIGLIAFAAGCASGPTGRGASGRVAIAVTDNGFEPASVQVEAGKPVTLVVTRKTDATCAKEIVFEDQGIRKELPLNQAVEITFTPSSPGEVKYSCGMSMVTGKVVVQ